MLTNSIENYTVSLPSCSRFANVKPFTPLNVNAFSTARMCQGGPSEIPIIKCVNFWNSLHWCVCIVSFYFMRGSRQPPEALASSRGSIFYYTFGSQRRHVGEYITDLVGHSSASGTVVYCSPSTLSTFVVQRLTDANTFR